ncbi:MAG TPA: head-tail connector protein [Candidatus Hypogeohydataceae bacterium YC40]
MTLTTLAAVKEYLGLAGTGEDSLLNRLMDWATNFIHSYCGRIFLQGNYDEYYDGDGTDSLLSHQFPIVSVNSLEVDGVIQDSTSFVVYAQIGLIRLNCGIFSKGKNNTRLQYTAGYAFSPKDLEQACIELVAMKYYDRGRERLGVEKKDSTSFAAQPPQEIKQVLDLYKRYGV